MYPRIHRLSTAPKGLCYAVRLLMTEKSDEICWADEREREELNALGDARLRAMVVRYVDTCSKLGVEWSASWCIQSIAMIGKGFNNMLSCWISKTKTRGPKSLQLALFFKETHRFLFERHSSEVGRMLALKVFGHLLPLEIIELIGDA